MIVIDRIEGNIVIAIDSNSPGAPLKIDKSRFIGKEEDIREGSVIIPSDGGRYTVDKFTTRILSERKKKEYEEQKAASDKSRLEKARAAAFKYLDTIESIDLTPDRAICRGTKEGMSLTLHITDDGNGRIVG